MSTEQWAMAAVLASILTYPTWCAVKALFWAGVDRWGTDDPAPVADPTLLIDWHTRRPTLTDQTLADTLTAWSHAAAGHPYIDHAPCEGDCDRVICCCPLADAGLPCEGTTGQACSHHTMVCDECRDTCPDCHIDYLDDAGVQ